MPPVPSADTHARSRVDSNSGSTKKRSNRPMPPEDSSPEPPAHFKSQHQNRMHTASGANDNGTPSSSPTRERSGGMTADDCGPQQPGASRSDPQTDTTANEVLTSRSSIPEAVSSSSTRRRHAKAIQPSKGTSRAGQGKASGSQPGDGFDWKPVAMFLALTAGGALLWRMLQNKRSKPRCSKTGGVGSGCAIPGKAAIQSRLQLPPNRSSDRPQLLLGTTFAIADLFEVQGYRRAGAAGNGSAPPAENTAEVLTFLQDAGACGSGKTLTPELNLGLLGAVEDMAGNATAPDHVSGGVGGGCAAAVASGEVDFAVGTDHLAGVRVSAACCGMFAFRPTHGELPVGGTTLVCPSLETVSWVAGDVARLQQVASALQLPGGAAGHNKADVIQFAICRDLFRSCDDVMRAASNALDTAALRWAGDEMVSNVPITKYLADKLPSLAKFVADGERMTVMDALVDAVEALQVSEVAAAHPDYVESADRVSSATVELARQVAVEAKAAVRSACGRGVILAMPTLPGPPPRRDVAEKEIHTFEDRALQLTAFAALSGAPVVVIPVLVPGLPPLSVTLMGMFKSDVRLLAVAAKLAPLIATAAREQVPKQPSQNGTANGHAPDQKQPRSSPAQAPADPKAEEASAGQDAKDRGNAAFKAGDFAGAIAAYSEAIQADRRNPVYYSNRAMAALKVMEFEQAENDCSAALKLEGALPKVKTLLRRGTARMAQHKFRTARADFTRVLNLEPSNKQAREELRNLKIMEDTYHIVEEDETVDDSLEF